MSLSFKRLADTGNTYIAEFVSCCGFESRLQSLQKNEIAILVKLSRQKNQQQPKQSAIKRDIKLKLLFDVEFISLEKEKSQKLDSFFSPMDRLWRPILVECNRCTGAGWFANLFED